MDQKKHLSSDAPEACGERIRLLREHLSIGITKFAAKHNLKRTTLSTWELGRHGGLTAKGALLLIEAFKKEGINVTLEWLLHGKSFDPLKQTAIQPSANSDNKIVQELQFFHQLHPNAVDAIISDDSLEPCFSKNDIVAGIRLFGRDINNIVGSICIVQLQTGEVFVRKLLKGDKAEFYTLLCTNQKAKTTKHSQKNLKLFSAARVIWHRRVI